MVGIAWPTAAFSQAAFDLNDPLQGMSPPAHTVDSKDNGSASKSSKTSSKNQKKSDKGLKEVSFRPNPSQPAPVLSSLPKATAPGFTEASSGHMQQIFALLQKAGIQPQDASFVVEPVDGSMPAYAHNGERVMSLASTTKVITSLAALDTLGAQYRWATRAYPLGSVDPSAPSAQLHGHLMIVGGGDPTMTYADLLAWFKNIQSNSFQHIQGNIVVDRQVFRLSSGDQSNVPPEQDGVTYHRWPEGLIVNKGILQAKLQVKDGAAQWSFNPPLDGVKVNNQLVVRSGPCRSNKNAPNMSLSSGDTLSITFQGELSPQCGVTTLETSTLSDGAFVRAVIGAAWREAGGTLTGRVVERTTESTAQIDPVFLKEWNKKPWAARASKPLSQVLRDMNKVSDNLIARHLMLSLSRGFPQRAGSLQEARSRVSQWLKKQGFSNQDINVDNGSGLAYNETARPRALVSLLRQAWLSKKSQIFKSSLPIAGLDGTLSRRFTNNEVKGHAFLKTGTLSNTRALAGYVEGADGKIYAVAAVINHPNAEKGVPALDEFIRWVKVR